MDHRLVQLCNESISIEKRFWENVNKKESDDCWEWTASVCKDGYGKFYFSHKHISAHRFSWELNCGSIPLGMLVLHKCNNRKCINPNHLYIGTQSDNMYDAAKSHYNYQKGELNNRTRLTNDDVIEIRRLATSGLEQKIVAAMFGINQSAVSKIILRKRWAHV